MKGSLARRNVEAHLAAVDFSVLHGMLLGIVRAPAARQRISLLFKNQVQRMCVTLGLNFPRPVTGQVRGNRQCYEQHRCKQKSAHYFSFARVNEKLQVMFHKFLEGANLRWNGDSRRMTITSKP